jgi:hypothetical protein
VTLSSRSGKNRCWPISGGRCNSTIVQKMEKDLHTVIPHRTLPSTSRTKTRTCGGSLRGARLSLVVAYRKVQEKKATVHFWAPENVLERYQTNNKGPKDTRRQPDNNHEAPQTRRNNHLETLASKLRSNWRLRLPSHGGRACIWENFEGHFDSG